MGIHIHIHHHNDENDLIITLLKKIIMTQSELAAELKSAKDQNEKARAEILAKFTALEEAVANAGNTTPEVDTALAELKASIQTDDDLNPDA